MQTLDLSTYMESAVAEVLEAMCFISSDGTVNFENGLFQSDWISGELDFLGEESGTFGIAVPPATAAIIAANFLGEEEADLTDREKSEVVCELSNMVCGTLLAQVDSKKIYTLSKPRPESQYVPSAQSQRIDRVYSTDEGYLHAWIVLRPIQ